MNDVRFHIKGVILDLDGTIVDSKEAYLDAATKAFSAFGQKLVNDKTAFEIPKRFELGLSLDDLTQGIAVRSFCEAYLKAYYAATAVRSKPFPHVAEALERLSKKAKLALTTRRYVPKDEVVKQLSRFGLSKHLDVIVTGVDTLNPKPSPEPLLKCASANGCENIRLYCGWRFCHRHKCWKECRHEDGGGSVWNFLFGRTSERKS